MMEQAMFVELLNGILKSEFKIAQKDIRYLKDGAIANHDDAETLDLIRSCNLHYHKIKSDILKGNYLLIRLEEEEDAAGYARFDISYLMDEYKTNGWARVKEIIEANMGMYKNSGMQVHLVQQLTDYESIKSRLFICPVNHTENRFILLGKVYSLIGDIALVLSYTVFEQGTLTAHVKIPIEIFESWELPFEKVFEDALLSMAAKKPPRMYKTPQEVETATKDTGQFMNNPSLRLAPTDVPNFTVTGITNGASAFFYKGVAEKIAEIMGGNYYVAFTSTEDFHVHREGSVSPKFISERLKDTNQKFPATKLSDQVFYYDTQNQKLSPVDISE